MIGPEVSRKPTPSSAATICASVVLPSPGGPANRTWSSASPRVPAASMNTARLARSWAWPMNSASRRGRRLTSPSSGAAAGLTIRSRHAVSSFKPSRTSASTARSAPEPGLHAGERRHRPRPGHSPDAARPRARRPRHRPAVDRRAARCRPGCGRAPTRSLSSDTIRAASRRRRLSRATASPCRRRRWRWRARCGRSVPSSDSATRAPTPCTVCSRRNQVRSAASGKPYSVIPSSRSCSSVCSSTASPTRGSRSSVAGATVTR